MCSFFESLNTVIEDFHKVATPAYYKATPPYWNIIITDVENSTEAIRIGRYKEVKAMGYIRNHIHFVDVNSGGYAVAAQMMKGQKIER